MSSTSALVQLTLKGDMKRLLVSHDGSPSSTGLALIMLLGLLGKSGWKELDRRLRTDIKW
jgi:hypothetical protein